MLLKTRDYSQELFMFPIGPEVFESYKSRAAVRGESVALANTLQALMQHHPAKFLMLSH